MAKCIQNTNTFKTQSEEHLKLGPSTLQAPAPLEDEGSMKASPNPPIGITSLLLPVRSFTGVNPVISSRRMTPRSCTTSDGPLTSSQEAGTMTDPNKTQNRHF